MHKTLFFTLLFMMSCSLSVAAEECSILSQQECDDFLYSQYLKTLQEYTSFYPKDKQKEILKIIKRDYRFDTFKKSFYDNCYQNVSCLAFETIKFWQKERKKIPYTLDKQKSKMTLCQGLDIQECDAIAKGYYHRTIQHISEIFSEDHPLDGIVSSEYQKIFKHLYPYASYTMDFNACIDKSNDSTEEETCIYKNFAKIRTKLNIKFYPKYKDYYCKADSDCSNDGGVCDFLTGECIQCRTNQDCKNQPVLSYCNLTSDNLFNPCLAAPRTGTCIAISEDIENVSSYVKSKAPMNWWSSHNFCSAQNKSIINIFDKCTAEDKKSLDSEGWAPCEAWNIIPDESSMQTAWSKQMDDYCSVYIVGISKDQAAQKTWLGIESNFSLCE